MTNDVLIEWMDIEVSNYQCTSQCTTKEAIKHEN